MNKVLLGLFVLVVLTSQSSQQGLQCPQGHLSFNGACRPITYVEGCAIYAADNHCKSCEYGYILREGDCLWDINSTADCCATYGSDGRCTQCAAGLFAKEPFCERNEIYGCLVKTGSRCAVCGHGLSYF